MITKKEVQQIQPKPFVEQLSYTRYRNGQIVPVTAAGYSPPRVKREWSFTGTHKVTLPDGSIVERPGQYVARMRRP